MALGVNQIFFSFSLVIRVGRSPWGEVRPGDQVLLERTLQQLDFCYGALSMTRQPQEVISEFFLLQKCTVSSPVLEQGLPVFSV